MAEFTFPTEQIDLPSGGVLYPEGSPLRSGKIDIKYMTAKEEDILTSTNLIQKGIVIDKLLESLIVTPGVKPQDLFVGDLNAVMVAARILGYGKDYDAELACISCVNKFPYKFDLSTLEMVETPAFKDKNEYEFKLPTGIVITFKLLTRKDEIDIEKEVAALQKLSKSAPDGDTSTRLRYMITSVNGNTDKKAIRDFSEAMILRDVRAFRDEVKRVTPDVNFELQVTCPSCDHEMKVRMPLGVTFFWPDFGV